MIKFKKLNVEANVPTKAHLGDSGWDVCAVDNGNVNEEYGYLEYSTGLAVELPEGYELQLRARSSISKYDLVLANGVGTIDCGYRGEITVRFKPVPRFGFDTTPKKESFKLWLPHPLRLYKKGDKIAQLVLQRVIDDTWNEVPELNVTSRQGGGFGSSDRK